MSTNNPDKFRNPATRVRINTDTYIKFDGSDQLTMQNIYSERGMRIKYDIMLILYEMINWTTVGELIAPWPPDDQEKIMDHLAMLAESKIIIDETSGVEAPSESGLSEFLGNKIHINVENHHNMLRDYVRLAAYRRAIEQHTTTDTVAVDLGCGTGILSFFTAKAGAKKVYAIERRPDVILLAQELAKANGLDNQIEFLEGSSSHIKESQLTPKPDLLVAEILGNGILEENVLEFTLDARDRFLKPGGMMIPCGLDIYVFAYNSGIRQDKRLEVSELNDLYGFKFDLLGDVLTNKLVTRTDRYNTYANQSMSDSLCVKSIDFRTLDNTVFVQEFDLLVTEDGEVTSFCAYFKADLDGSGTVLTNSPWAPSTHWTQLTFTLPQNRSVKKGDLLKLELVYDGNLRLQMKD